MAVDKYELADIMRAMAEGLASTGELERVKAENKQMQAVAMKFIKCFIASSYSTNKTFSRSYNNNPVNHILDRVVFFENKISEKRDELGLINRQNEEIENVSKEIFKMFTGVDYKEE